MPSLMAPLNLAFALFYLLYYYTIISILLVFFECYILHTEQYFSLIVDMINTALEFISV